MTASRNAVAPEVHAVRSDDRFIYVESAGLSLHSFGPLEANQYEPPLGPRAFTFRIPRNPKPAVSHMSAPLGIIGVFATGVPMYNPIGTSSYQDQNIWHRDAVAAAPVKASPLLSALTHDAQRHSPIIGFALDGYPIYGPFGWDAAGNLRRMKSGYRPRRIAQRNTLPDGIKLTPAQEGPAVGPDFPLGSFAEDYEYDPALGDLDQFNGRFAKTPEYPQGTYAYFLATTDAGEIRWPYLIGPRYFGEASLDSPARLNVHHSKNVNLWTDRAQIKDGEAVRFTLVFNNAQGRPIRFLEKVHQQPVHLIVVSKDLADFDHIHPEPVPGDALSVAHTFSHPGEYWIYADYTAPGEPPSVARFAVDVEGGTGIKRDADECSEPRLAGAVCFRGTKTVDGVRVSFSAPQEIRAGEDVPLAFTLINAESNQPIADLDTWLGAWGHIMIISENGERFIHAHPLENAMKETQVHTHVAQISGPSPRVISTITGFNSAGLYKLWFQFQRHGQLITVPWVIKVGEPAEHLKDPAPPADAIKVIVSRSGFSPARLEIPAGKAVRIAFTRSDAENCASEVVFPDLGLRRGLPPGETVVVELPPQPQGTMKFACGMGMYRGAVVIR